ncbi:MAG: amidohydrolase family protein, partial [Firmicutes bacterium]|nr:amidohydrolase family protein [Bacillota bacterium]
MYDLIIKNVRILDGTGAPWVRGAVAVQGGRIVRVGTFEEEAKKVVDGQDKYLAPGFIDIHCHSDGTLPVYPTAESRILQGVTTEIGGDCGLGVAPVSQDPEKKKQLIDYVGGGLSYDWTTIGEYLDDLEEKRPSVNFGTAVGHGAIRIYAMGFEARKPTSEEMEVMKAALRQALDDGAFCMSSGLIYPPGCYSDIDEMAELCKELVPY